MRVYLLCAFAVASICAFGEEGGQFQTRCEQRVLEPVALHGIGVINSMCSSNEWRSQSNSMDAVEIEKRVQSFDGMKMSLGLRVPFRQSFPTEKKKMKPPLWMLLIILGGALRKHGKVGKCLGAIIIMLGIGYLVYSQMNSSSETQSTDAREKVMMRDEIMKKLR